MRPVVGAALAALMATYAVDLDTAWAALMQMSETEGGLYRAARTVLRPPDAGDDHEAGA
ncbi:hypothetical protein ABFT23_21465 [Nocardioides sp. C4-1]|uniref:hypothetical protein n=1 Tax=Nocardioides sp. C4-1 TaxID=3151851 RepID=UPI003262EF66